MDELHCTLIREDGSEWRVRKLIRDGDGLRVNAAPASGGEAPSGQGEHGLFGELLTRGDRIQWRTGDGQEVWAMKVPLGAAESRGNGDHAAERGATA